MRIQKYIRFSLGASLLFICLIGLASSAQAFSVQSFSDLSTNGEGGENYVQKGSGSGRSGMSASVGPNEVIVEIGYGSDDNDFFMDVQQGYFEQRGGKWGVADGGKKYVQCGSERRGVAGFVNSNGESTADGGDANKNLVTAEGFWRYFMTRWGWDSSDTSGGTFTFGALSGGVPKEGTLAYGCNGHGGDDTPSSVCVHAIATKYDPNTFQLVGPEREVGSCATLGYNRDMIRGLVRADSGKFIVGINQFNFGNDAHLAGTAGYRKEINSFTRNAKYQLPDELEVNAVAGNSYSGFMNMRNTGSMTWGSDNVISDACTDFVAGPGQSCNGQRVLSSTKYKLKRTDNISAIQTAGEEFTYLRTVNVSYSSQEDVVECESGDGGGGLYYSDRSKSKFEVLAERLFKTAKARAICEDAESVWVPVYSQDIPNDVTTNSVGRFAVDYTVPAGTPGGTYNLKFRMIDLNDGQYFGDEITVPVVVPNTAVPNYNIRITTPLQGNILEGGITSYDFVIENCSGGFTGPVNNFSIESSFSPAVSFAFANSSLNCGQTGTFSVTANAGSSPLSTPSVDRNQGIKVVGNSATAGQRKSNTANLRIYQRPTVTITANPSSINIGQSSNVTWAAAAANTGNSCTITGSDGIAVNESNAYYSQMTNGSGSWSGSGGAWTSGQTGDWVKQASVSGVSAGVPFKVVNAGTARVYTDSSGYALSGTTSYYIRNAPANSRIYWSSSIDGTSTGENDSYYGQVVDGSGNADFPGGQTWQQVQDATGKGVGNWVKQAKFYTAAGVYTGVSVSVQFAVSPTTPMLRMNKTVFTVGEAPVYTIVGAAPNASIYWSSFRSGTGSFPSNGTFSTGFQYSVKTLNYSVTCTGFGGTTATANTSVNVMAAKTCPIAFANFSANSANVGSNISVTPPAGFSGGSLISDNSGAVQVINSSTLLAKDGTVGNGTANVRGTGWNYSNGATGCVLSPVNIAVKDFKITLSPASQTVYQGASAAYTVSVVAINGFTNGVNLAQTGAPGPGPVVFGQTTNITPGNTTPLTIPTNGTTAIQTHNFTVTGTWSGNNRTAAGSMVVQASPNPTAPSTVNVYNWQHASEGIGSDAQMICGRVKVKWSFGANNDGYRVYRNSSNSFVGATNVSGNLSSVTDKYYDTPVSPSTNYYYWVVGYKGATESAPTASVPTNINGGGPCEPNPPGTPTPENGVLDSSVTCGDIRVRWTASSNAQWYELYRTPSGGSPTQIGGNYTGTEYLDVAVPNNSYVYSVRAVRQIGPVVYRSVLMNSSSVSPKYPCTANTTNADKDVIALNGRTNPGVLECNGATERLDTSLGVVKYLDTVTFQLCIKNDGNVAYSQSSIADSLVNLVNPLATGPTWTGASDSGWDAKFAGDFAGCDTGIPTFSVTGVAGRQVITFTGIPNIPAGKTCKLQFKAKIWVSSTAPITDYYFQNKYMLNSGEVATPKIPFFTTADRDPKKNETK